MSSLLIADHLSPWKCEVDDPLQSPIRAGDTWQSSYMSVIRMSWLMLQTFTHLNFVTRLQTYFHRCEIMSTGMICWNNLSMKWAGSGAGHLLWWVVVDGERGPDYNNESECYQLWDRNVMQLAGSPPSNPLSIVTINCVCVQQSREMDFHLHIFTSQRRFHWAPRCLLTSLFLLAW